MKHEDFNKWRWEFFRRSEQAIVGWERIKQLRQQSAHPFDCVEQVSERLWEQPYIFTEEYREESKVCAEVGIEPPFPDISLSWDELVFGEPEMKDIPGMGEVPYHTAEQAWSRVMLDRSMPKAFRVSHSSKNEKHVLNIRLDLSVVRSLDETLQAAKKAVLMYAAIEGIQIGGLNAKANERYQIILEVGDLLRKGRTHEQVAAEAFPDDWESTDANVVDTLKARVSRYGAEYERLTKQWYKISEC